MARIANYVALRLPSYCVCKHAAELPNNTSPASALALLTELHVTALAPEGYPEMQEAMSVIVLMKLK